jgi:hypothetical protein
VKIYLPGEIFAPFSHLNGRLFGPFMLNLDENYSPLNLINSMISRVEVIMTLHRKMGIVCA